MLHTTMRINKQTLISPRATANMFPVRCGASAEGDQNKRLQTRTGDNCNCQSKTEASLSLHCLTVQANIQQRTKQTMSNSHNNSNNNNTGSMPLVNCLRTNKKRSKTQEKQVEICFQVWLIYTLDTKNSLQLMPKIMHSSLCASCGNNSWSRRATVSSDSASSACWCFSRVTLLIKSVRAY